MDGTLTDPREGILACIRHALLGLARPVPSESALLECIGSPLHRSFCRLVEAELVDSAIELYRERFRSIGMFENNVYPGVSTALADLHAAGHKLRVVTSKPMVFAVRILEHFQLDRYFADIHGPDLDGNLADKTELLAFVLEAAQANAQDATMLGDRSHDVLGARNNGIRAAGALWGYGSRLELLRAGADDLFDHISQFSEGVLRAPDVEPPPS